MKVRLLTAAIVAVSPVVALAGWSGLALMPIADILGHKEAGYGYGFGGTEGHISKAISHGHGFEFGAFDKLEFGADNDFSGGTALNAKILLYEEPEEARFAFSAGVGDFVDGEGTTYFVGRHNFDGFRLHAAFLRDDADHFAIGIDAPLFGNAAWSLEHMSGPGAATWAGLYFPISAVPGLEIDFAAGVPANRDEGIQYSVGLVYGWRFR